MMSRIHECKHHQRYVDKISFETQEFMFSEDSFDHIIKMH